MTYIFAFLSLVNKFNTLLIVRVPERVYRALQLIGHEVTLQRKKECIVRTKDYWKIKMLKLIMYLFTFLCLTCAKEYVSCLLGNSIFFLFSVLASDCRY